MKQILSILRKPLLFLLLLIVPTLLFSCWDDDQLPVDDPTPTASISLTQDGLMHEFVFNGYEPLQAKPINVFYYIPLGGDMATMPILFIFPGESRDADTHLELFTSWAAQNKVMLFALSFPTTYYSSTTEYILGGMNTRQSAEGLLPRSQWNFNYVETLFDEIRLFTHSTRTTYDMWGHSAGAQYVHRYVTFMPNARVDRAVVCNSGWFTVADINKTFPYGLSPVEGVSASYQQILFARKMFVYVGSNDTSTEGLNTNPGSVEQGNNRKERGTYYYNRSQELAQQLGFQFNWRFGQVTGVAHEAGGMARGTMQLLVH